ncbi:hypothetical protein FACS189485_18100 [Spirochaetia bacterium]|nr:hypothetical protein FACS189485_18100 [Spirochaetia bacterium]
MTTVKDLTGQRFGRLTVLYKGGKDVSGKTLFWCRCECGIEKFIRGSALQRGGTISCGCYHRENARQRATKHGLSNTRIYNIYKGIKTRCHNDHRKEYKHYGGRGIDLCVEWPILIERYAQGKVIETPTDKTPIIYEGDKLIIPWLGKQEFTVTYKLVEEEMKNDTFHELKDVSKRYQELEEYL